MEYWCKWNKYFIAILLTIITCFSVPFLLLLLLLSRRRKSSGNGQLPLGPPGWPVFGNIFNLGTKPHRSLAELRHKYGDVLWVRLGTVDTMVVLSSKAAADLFKNHDAAFAGRAVTETSQSHRYNESSMAMGAYSPYWRLLRRLMTAKMLAAKRINDTAAAI